MKQFNGTDYDTLYPKTIAEQVDGVYGKDEILNNSTKALYGLTDSAVPDDVLSFLGKYAQYWWKRRTFETALILGEEKNEVVGAKANSATGYDISYSSDITVDLENKTVSLKEPISTVWVSYNNKSNADVLAGKYFISDYDSIIYYATPGVTATSEYNYDSNQYYVYILAKSCVVDDILGNFEFIQSSNRNAYPDSGVQNGYEYQYLGVPFENAVTAPKIATGSYIGTGTYGSSNPNTISLPGTPILLVIESNFLYANDSMKNITRASYSLTVIDTGDSRIVSWYSGDSADYQGNVSGRTYKYTALIW